MRATVTERFDLRMRVGENGFHPGYRLSGLQGDHGVHGVHGLEKYYRRRTTAARLMRASV
jgi:hypothetical protein